MTTAGIVLLVLTGLFWALLTGMLSSVVGQTAHGDASMGLAINWIYSIILLFLTWISLSGLLLVAGDQGVLPAWAGVAAIFVSPLSGAAALTALYLLNSTPARWPAAIPAVIPPLVALYVFALYQPSVRVTATGLPVGIAVWAVVIGLCVPILPALSYKLDERDRNEAARKAALADPVQKARRREENLTKIKALAPETPLKEWGALLNPESEVRPEVLEILGKSSRRQSDMEELVRTGGSFWVSFVPELDLTATPNLCSAMNSFLWDSAFTKQLRGQDGHTYEADREDSALEVVRWFRVRGCTCESGLDRYEETVRQYYKDSPERQKCLVHLASLRASH